MIMTDEVKVKLHSGEDTTEILMDHVPYLRQPIRHQGRVWMVIAVSFLATRKEHKMMARSTSK
jgi:hypothetical protein